jgi:type 1 fimbria pilin
VKIKRISLLWQLALALALSGTYSAAHAACNFVNGRGPESATVGFGDVIVQRDTPVGTVLASTSARQLNNVGWYNCSYDTGSSALNDWDVTWRPGIYNQVASQNGDDYVLATNIPGVGIRIYTGIFAPNESYPYKTLGGPDIHGGTKGNFKNIFSTPEYFELVKTASVVQAGTLTAGMLSYFYVKEFHSAGTPPLQLGQNFLNGSSRIIPVKCSIRTPNIQLPLADVMVTDFTSPGMTAKPKPFDVGLDCDAGARVNAKLTGTQNSSTSVNSVLQLTGAGSAGVASGVGIQLLYNNLPLELNKNIVLKTSTGGQESFPFTAQYYQTAAKVMGGTANTTATLEMTYQ